MTRPPAHAHGLDPGPAAPLLAIVADDLTGAADAGLGFVRAGLATSVVWEDVESLAGLTDVPVVLAIDTRSRALDLGQAIVASQRVVRQIRDARIPMLYKKVDSTLRGHIGDELRVTLGAWQSDALAIVALAFPEMGRTTVDGLQRVHGVPVPRAIGAMLEDASMPVRLVAAGAVRSDSLHLEFAHHARGPARAIVCDAETSGDLAAIARAGLQLGGRVCWVGSGGLAPALAEALGLPASRMTEASISRRGSVLVVVGSGTPLAREQAINLERTGVPRIIVPIRALEFDDEALRSSLTAAIAGQLHDGGDLIVTIEDHPGTTATDDERLVMGLGEILRPVLPRVGGLVATGGATASAILRAWGVTALQVCGEVEAGVPLSLSVGPDRMPVVTKAGGFGHAATLVRARDAVRQTLSRKP